MQAAGARRPVGCARRPLLSLPQPAALSAPAPHLHARLQGAPEAVNVRALGRAGARGSVVAKVLHARGVEPVLGRAAERRAAVAGGEES